MVWLLSQCYENHDCKLIDGLYLRQEEIKKNRGHARGRVRWGDEQHLRDGGTWVAGGFGDKGDKPGGYDGGGVSSSGDGGAGCGGGDGGT